MSDSKIFNVYCDESCHIENDNIPTVEKSKKERDDFYEVSGKVKKS